MPPGSVPSGPESGRDQLFSLVKNVSFVTVPVTVKDDEGKLVDGLLQKDFTILEDGVQQRLTLFTSDPFPLSAALVIDQGMSDLTLEKGEPDILRRWADRLARSTRWRSSPTATR